MKKLTILSMLVLLAGAVPLKAQFYTTGNENGLSKWWTFSTQNYRFVYPQGCDSLARAYSGEWERAHGIVGAGTGLVPNEAYRKPMPVVLHPFLGYSNGLVSWTPRRMEMFTGPDMYSPDPVPWVRLLALHEGRHASQMQYTNEGWMHVLGWFSGEIPAGMALFYSEPSFLEGDAVVCETAQTLSGRGRTADFLEYYRAALDEGDFRSYARWRYGSQKLYTPDYYKAGYLMMGGVRACFGTPDIVKDYLSSTRKLSLGFRHYVKERTGLTFEHAFDRVLEKQAGEWQADADSRAPYMPSEQVTSFGDRFVEYSGLAAGADGKLYALRSGMSDIQKLVSLDVSDCSERVLRSCGASSRLAVCGDMILWTANKPGLRWEMESSSPIRYYRNGSMGTLVGGKRLYNPTVSADGAQIAVCGSPADGSQTIDIYSPDGNVLQRFVAPSGMQPYECVFVGGKLYAACLVEAGEGIYCVTDGFTEVLPASPVKVNHLGERIGYITFVSDRTGENELYAVNQDTGMVCQLTNLRRGGTDFVFMGDHLYYTVLSSAGRMICRTPVQSLHVKVVDFSVRHQYELADRLSSIEGVSDLAASGDSTVFSSPKPYNRLAHSVKVHSWLPFYVDADNLASLSFASIRTAIEPGASVMFQNDLGTLYGSAGYGISKGLATHFTYSGLYPVFEVEMASGADFRSPYAMLTSYVPFSFSSDGWRRAIIPFASAYLEEGCNWWQMGLRAYAIQSIPSSCIYPKLGIGASVGYEPGSSLSYLLYGYLPGFYETHGIGVQAAYERFSGASSVTVKYAMPLFPVDWDRLSPYVYVRNFELIPSWSFFHRQVIEWLPLDYHTVGGTFSVVLGNLLFIPYTIHMGVHASYKIDMFNPWSVTGVMSIDI